MTRTLKVSPRHAVHEAALYLFVTATLGAIAISMLTVPYHGPLNLAVVTVVMAGVGIVVGSLSGFIAMLERGDSIAVFSRIAVASVIGTVSGGAAVVLVSHLPLLV